MIYTSYLDGIVSRKPVVCGSLKIIPMKNGFSVSGDFSDEKIFYKRLALLKAGIALWAYKHKDTKLLAACGGKFVFSTDQNSLPENTGSAQFFDAWGEIEAIFSCQKEVAAHWLAEALSGKKAENRYLALYYAWMAAGGSVETGDFAALKRIADGIRQDEEALEEAGQIPEKILYDEAVFQRISEKCFKLLQSEKTGGK